MMNHFLVNLEGAECQVSLPGLPEKEQIIDLCCFETGRKGRFEILDVRNGSEPARIVVWRLGDIPLSVSSALVATKIP
jgi:hypothetical protein